MGSWPVMVTPFTKEGRIDYISLERLIDWYELSGSAGLFAICQSSEMMYLTPEERAECASFIKKKAKIPVIASTLAYADHHDQLEEWKRMADTGVDALVLLTNSLDGGSGREEEFIEGINRAMDAIPSHISLGLYECPVPYKRLVSLNELQYAANTGRFAFVKDTCCNAETIQKRIEVCKGTSLKIYNANAATLLESLRMGANGFSGIIANFAPDLCAWLCCNWKDEPEKAQLVQSVLTVGSYIERSLYPAVAKLFLLKKGILQSFYSRSCSYQNIDRTYQTEVEHLDYLMSYVRREIGGLQYEI